MKLVVGQLLSQRSQAMAFLVHCAIGRVRAPVDSDLAQKLETDIDAAFELSPYRIQVYLKPRHLCAGLNVRAALRQNHQLCFRVVQMSDQKFALGTKQRDREGSWAVGRMCSVPKQLVRNLQIGDGGVVCGRSPRPLASRKIDGNDPLTFDFARNRADAAVKLVGDDVEPLARVVRRYLSASAMPMRRCNRGLSAAGPSP